MSVMGEHRTLLHVGNLFRAMFVGYSLPGWGGGQKPLCFFSRITAEALETSL